MECVVRVVGGDVQLLGGHPEVVACHPTQHCLPSARASIPPFGAMERWLEGLICIHAQDNFPPAQKLPPSVQHVLRLWYSGMVWYVARQNT